MAALASRILIRMPGWSWMAGSPLYAKKAVRWRPSLQARCRGAGGQLLAVVPSRDLVVVLLYGGRRARWLQQTQPIEKNSRARGVPGALPIAAGEKAFSLCSLCIEGGGKGLAQKIMA